MFNLIFSFPFLFSLLAPVGEQAPDFTLPNTKGKEISLSDFKGKVVLIDFWASWCAPCRKENPNVVEAYNKYKKAKFKDASGFEIISISLDQDKKKWLDAIKKDKLSWKTHLSELTGWKSSITQKYGVGSIPMSFLVDSKGNIVAQGAQLRGLNLHIEIDKLLE